MRNRKWVLAIVAMLSFGGIVGLSMGCWDQSQGQLVRAEEADDGKCQEALDLIDLNVDTNQIVSSFRLPYLGQYNTSIAWVSSNSSVVSIISDSAYGSVAHVTRSEVNCPVTLTATASLKGSRSASKDFSLTVLKNEENPIEELPLAMDEDFSNYETGVELSNYYRWQCSSPDASIAHAVESIDGNVNNMEETKALAVSSLRTATSTAYTRTVNVKSSDAPDGAVLEGYFLVNGETNGVSLELVHSGTIVAGIGISSAAYAYYQAGGYVSTKQASPEEGVWQFFRLFFKPASGRAIFEIFDWNANAYVDLTYGAASYIEGSGVAGGSKGDIDGLRLNVQRGSRFGTTYFSHLKMNVASALLKTTPENPNRSVGIGGISNYDKVLFAFFGEEVGGLHPSFEVKNRFNGSVLLKEGVDYTVEFSLADSDDDSTAYRYRFVLSSTLEEKTVTQTVYFTSRESSVAVSHFKASYLKSRKATIGGVSVTVGYISLSGQALRNDGVLHYLILDQGSPVPSSEAVLSGNASVPGFEQSGTYPIVDHDFSLDSDSLPYQSQYDVYALTKNSYGLSEVYRSEDISTVVNIATCEEFQDMSSNLETLNSVFKLTQDLDFSTYYWAFDGASRSFTGVFDGQGHTISNLVIANASNASGVKTGIFFNLNGTIKNVHFVHATVTGYTDVGILGGNAYGCQVSNVRFTDCLVKQDDAITGGDGYFAIAVGRCRGGINDFTNISIDGAEVTAPQRTGLLVAGAVGTSSSCVVNVTNAVVEGTIEEDGAMAGLIGRNQGATINVTDAIISLKVLYSKKQVGTVLGSNETGSVVHANDIIGNLTIKDMTQPTYFGQFIGYDATTTGSGGKTFAYTCSNLFFLANDYSSMGDGIAPIKNAIDAGITIPIPDAFNKRFWETKTFLRDLDTSLVFSYDEETAWPILAVKNATDIHFTSDAFMTMVASIDPSRLYSSHYFIYKADDMLPFMSDGEKDAIPSDVMAKFLKAKADYEEMARIITGIGEGI